MSDRKTLEQAIAKLKSTNSGKYNELIFQWVKTDKISFATFEGLLIWLPEEKQRQIGYDSFD